MEKKQIYLKWQNTNISVILPQNNIIFYKHVQYFNMLEVHIQSVPLKQLQSYHILDSLVQPQYSSIN